MKVYVVKSVTKYPYAGHPSIGASEYNDTLGVSSSREESKEITRRFLETHGIAVDESNFDELCWYRPVRVPRNGYVVSVEVIGPYNLNMYWNA